MKKQYLKLTVLVISMALCSFDLPSYGQSKYETIYKAITNPNSLVQKESAKVAGKIAKKTRQAEINARRFHPALPLKIDTNKIKAYTRISSLPALSAAQQKELKELNRKKELINVINRFCTYAKIDSQSCDVEDLSAFPLSDGQRKLSVHIEQELLEIGNGRDITVQRSDNEYIYVKIPSNVKKAVPSIMFMAHLDTTPEAPGGDICPLVHFNYSGQDIILPSGIVISPDYPQGKHLRDCIGKTIITSDGTTLLGADDKSGCTILVTLIEEILKNKKIKHGDLYFVFSQNEDIGRAADKYEASYIDTDPEIVIDVDGDQPDRFSVENFTAAMRIYRFCGKDAHPGDGFANKYGDALTAASYFIGNIPPSKHPSASKGKQGYIHCYSMTHPVDESGNVVLDDYLVKVRLRYFDKAEGDTMRVILNEAAATTAKAYPFVKVEAQDEIMQYENVAYSMYPDLPNIIRECSAAVGIPMAAESERGGTTAAMMAAKGLRGGSCIYSGQQAEHSVYEWTCAEDMLQMVELTKAIIETVAKKQ